MPRCATSSMPPPILPSMIPSRLPPSSGPTFIAERAQASLFGTPMPIQVLMPALSPTMEKGNLAKWIKSEGDKIKAGDVIAEIETDKATMEVEAIDDGTLGKILVPEGTADVAVNTPIAMILAEGEDAGALKGAAPAQAQKAAEAPAQAEKAAESAPPAQQPAAEARAPAPPPQAPAAPQPQAEIEPEVPEG